MSLFSGFLDGGYIIANTSALPHKNAAGIVKSYERYCQMTDKPLPLTIVGNHISSAKSSLFIEIKPSGTVLRSLPMKTPVLCSDTSSLPEVVGDAAVCVNPEDTEKAAQAILKLAEDDSRTV